MLGGTTNNATMFGNLNTSTPTSTPVPAGNNFQLPQKQSMFGNINNTLGTSTPSPSTGFFGNSNTQQNQNNPLSTNTGGFLGNKSATSSTPANIFGNSANTNSGGLFGKPSQTTSTATSTPAGGLFGNASAPKPTGSLFGNSITTNNAQQSSSGGLFGNNTNLTQNSAGSLLGNKGISTQPQPTTGGLFGAKPSIPSYSNTGGLFGQKSTTTTGGLFGTSQSNISTNNSLFNNMSQQQTQQQPQQLNNPSMISSNPYGLNINPIATSTSMPESLTPSTSLRKQREQNNEPSFRSLNPDPYKKRASSVSSTLSSNLLPASSHSTLISKLSSRLKSTRSSATLSGIFSPSHTKSWLAPESSKLMQQSTPLSSQSSFSKTGVSNNQTSINLLLAAKTESISDIKKLTIDPERSAAKKLKLLSGKATVTKMKVQDPTENLQRRTVTFMTNTHKQDNTPETLTFEEEKERLSPPLNENAPSIANNKIDLGYWCSPSPNQLLNLTAKQLSSVSNFVIGRKGYGHITFNYDVDLTAFAHDFEGELFGKVVIFNSTKTVEVYPNDNTKPDLGYGMNVPATITLEGIYPIDKVTKKPIKNASDILEVQYFGKKLRSMKDMEFISYNPYGGIWTFKVQHFSIWGLVNKEDAEVDQDLLDEYKRKQRETENSMQTNESESVTQDMVYVPSNDALETQSDLILQENPYEPNVNEKDFIFLENEPKLDISNDWVEQLKLANKSLRSVFAGSNALIKNSKQDIDLLVQDFNEELESQRTIKRERKLYERQISIAKFTNNGQLLLTTENGSVKETTPFKTNVDVNLMKKLFSRQQDLTTIEIRSSNNFPMVKNSALKFSDVMNLQEKGSRGYMLWELSSILFDPIELPFNVTEETTKSLLLKKQRHQDLCSWLVDNIREEIKFKLHNSTDPLDKIFYYLMLNDVVTASKLAVDSNNGHLAIVISFLGSNDPTVRELSISQLSKWSSAGHETDHKISRIYQLLSGSLLENSHVLKRLLEEFSWLSIFALTLYYTTIDEDSLENLVASHITVLNSVQDDFTFKILSLFGAQTSTEELFIKSDMRKDKFDIQFAWFFIQILRFNNHRQFSDKLLDKLTLSFIEQIKSLSLTKEALYAMCFICDDFVSKQHIQSSITANIIEFNSPTNQYIMEELMIPKELIYSSIAINYKYKGDYRLEAENLLKAGNYNEAKNVVITKLGPKLILNFIAQSNKDKLIELDRVIKQFPKEEIFDWNNSIGVFENYLKLDYEKLNDKDLLISLINGLSIIINNYKNYKELSICCNEISKKVIDQLVETHEDLIDDKLKVELLKLPLGGPEKKYFKKLFNINEK
ncbi:hypothetical protein TBLA_0A01880 [Henningerozyma blattae CBS 6284]|uniref:Peptidase S59 domain-containing protein n=1 Tax=Henningerozyma blattae (strain ATCC 34711 / CBS 6284 / DSM 70876 / NBRC 10599 / NRRL Y-10934 / UCD 77-7) TaxID=1071380 RepID=I2GV37_HENB6|nr:hypothetical protein TBLA_0A01880 [Tetrapisispora blattae CBS 6284]CCH57989.1 hypothetical protein TBLA_0A01880 [Tetrapisispora blattae CBS 6284]